MIYQKCCICGRLIEGEAYNAKPYKNGSCCKNCKISVVDPAKENKRYKRY